MPKGRSRKYDVIIDTQGKKGGRNWDSNGKNDRNWDTNGKNDRNWKTNGKNDRNWDIKEKNDRNWDREQSMNPFVRNTGAFRQLKHSGLDPDDPGLDANLGLGYLENDVTLEGIVEESKAYKKKYEVDKEYLQDKAKKKIIQKRIFPKPKNPNLLTWIEKETIKYLHKLDPVEWSIERLADSFPATSGIIFKVLKGPKFMPRGRMIEYDLEVKQNWKLLTEGNLEIDPKLQQILANSNRKELGLSSGQVNQMEEDILLSYENYSNYLPKPEVPGQFGAIIVNYKKKLEAATNPPGDRIAEAPDLIEMDRLFGDNSIPGTPIRNEVSSWGETALLASDLDLARERSMDIDQFRRKYQKPRHEPEKIEENDNPYRKKYLKWLDQERSKSLEQTTIIPKISDGDVDETRDVSLFDKEVNGIEDSIVLQRGISEYTGEEEVFVFDENSGYKKPFLTPHNPDTIEIPKQLRKKHRMYRVDDCYYDQSGEFVYRVPGLN